MADIFANTEKIVLASSSPRRKSYLMEMGLSFRVVPASIEEKCAFGEDQVHYIRRLAQEKALCVAARYPDSWVVAADTVVCLDMLLLEKPVDKKDAIQMLMSLSGREHIVRTALCLHNREQSVLEICSVSTRVVFWDFSRDVASSYVDSGEPMDKAGSYGVQGKGAFLVREIHGSYSNVVGLPLYEFIEMLNKYDLISN
jgi:septum formation protein